MVIEESLFLLFEYSQILLQHVVFYEILKYLQFFDSYFLLLLDRKKVKNKIIFHSYRFYYSLLNGFLIIDYENNHILTIPENNGVLVTIQFARVCPSKIFCTESVGIIATKYNTKKIAT